MAQDSTGGSGGFLETVGDSVKAVISTVAHASGGGGAQQAAFSVDVEQIPGLIAKYEEARDKLHKILQKAQELQDVVPPGDDEVSKKLAKSLGDMAGSNDGCLSWAVEAGRKRLQSQIDQLKAAQAEYQAADEDATARQA